MKKHEILSPQSRAALFDPPTDPVTIVRHYTFSPDNLALIRQRRRDANRLGFAVHFAYLKFPGRVIGVCHRASLLERSGMILILGQSSGIKLELLRDDQMRYITTRAASQLTGLSTEKLREWTSRRALIPADVKPAGRGSPAEYSWHTILLLRIAVTLRERFDVELQAYHQVLADLREGLQNTSFIYLWGKLLAIRADRSWTLLSEPDPSQLTDDFILIRLNPHLEVLSQGFALPRSSTLPGQLDLFPAQAVPRPTQRRTVKQAEASDTQRATAKRGSP